MNNRKGSPKHSSSDVKRVNTSSAVRPKKDLNPSLALELNKATEYHQKKQFQLAKPIYEHVLSLVPEHFDSLQLYATLLAQTGLLKQALSILLRAKEVANLQIIDQSKLVGLFNNLGNIYKGLGQLELALKSYSKAIELKQEYADAYNNKGLVLYDLSLFDEALNCYEKATKLNPRFVQAFNNMGNAFRALGSNAQALSSFDQALAISPEYAQAYSNKGLVLQDLQNWDAALIAYQAALKLKPDYAEALNNCANVYKHLEQPQVAVEFYLAALGVRKDYVEAWNNLGSVFKEQKQFTQAEQCYTQAIELNPAHAQAFYNRGNLYKDLRKLSLALKDFECAVQILPSFSEAQLNIAIVQLTQGNTAQGWPGFEWRWKSKELSQSLGFKVFDKPLWLGSESLVNKTILLHAEQGLGDTIQFCRYASLVKGLGARVILQVPSELFNLLGTLVGVDTLLRNGECAGDFDFHCPLMSLPLAFKTDLQSTPYPNAYIDCDPNIAQVWRTRVDAKKQWAPEMTKRLKIGLVWSGNPKHLNDRNRSLTLSHFEDLVAMEHQFISLNKNLTLWDQECLTSLTQASMIKDFSPLIKDFSDTAGLVDCLDLVITVDTSVAHLGGAMGKPVWILLPFNSDWRWLTKVETTPWYNSVRLYRQDMPDDWTGVLAAVKSDLEAYDQNV